MNGKQIMKQARRRQVRERKRQEGYVRDFKREQWAKAKLTKETAIEFFRGFRSIHHLKTVMQGAGALDEVASNGWLGDCCRHMKTKPAGYWRDESTWPELIEIAQKFGNRKDWMEGDHASYTTANGIKGWLWKYCTAHMERYAGAKGNAVYVWRPTSMQDDVLSVMPGFHLVKVGATSTCQGGSRIVNCARNNGMDYELIALCETGEGDAFAFERVLKGLGVTPEMPYWYDGYTEFRIISDAELDSIRQLLGAQEEGALALAA